MAGTYTTGDVVFLRNDIIVDSVDGLDNALVDDDYSVADLADLAEDM